MVGRADEANERLGDQSRLTTVTGVKASSLEKVICCVITVKKTMQFQPRMEIEKGR